MGLSTKFVRLSKQDAIRADKNLISCKFIGQTGREEMLSYIKEWFESKGFTYFSANQTFMKNSLVVPYQIAEDIATPEEFEKLDWAAENNFKIVSDKAMKNLFLFNGVIQVGFFDFLEMDLETIIQVYTELICRNKQEIN